MTAPLDAHRKPPSELHAIYKQFQKIDNSTLDQDLRVLRLDQICREDNAKLSYCKVSDDSSKLRRTFAEFLGCNDIPAQELPSRNAVFKVNDLPGLFVYPCILPQSVQSKLLEKLLHRDLSNSQHLTNTHLHYNVPYPALASRADIPGTSSFFSRPSQDLSFTPKDASIHKPFSTKQFLNSKLRWITLGGQYDWTKKVYPSVQPPPFPSDIKLLVEDIFPTRAEAAIVNIYSPGDTLSLHRDVSEECDRPLVSISLGCDAIFVVGLEGTTEESKPRVAILRLRSGDAVLMSNESRYAWHGVPKVLKGTCPTWMQDWPAGDANEEGELQAWKGWMAGKRINLNIRQMFA